MPLIEDDTFGLVLHPFDLAANKVLALAGRLEARDWMDVLACHERLQPLGFLVWAACGKDPGYNPASLLNDAQRGGRYSQVELDLLDGEGARPDARQLGETWHAALGDAGAIVAQLPPEQIGTCVLTVEGELFRESGPALAAAARENRLRFHQGTIGGVWPRMTGRPAPE